MKGQMKGLGIVLLFLSGCVLADPARLSVYTIEEPPFNFVDHDGRLTGISVDVVTELLRRSGDKGDITLIPWARAYQEAQRTAGVVLFTAARTPEREDKFHWITDVVQNSWGFFAAKKLQFDINSLDDLKAVSRIGVLRGGAREKYLMENGFSNIVPVTTFRQLERMLENNRIDLFFYAELGLATAASVRDDELPPFKSVFNVLPPRSYILMSKATDPEVVTRWQQLAKEIKEDGTFNRIAQKWRHYLLTECRFDATTNDGVLDLRQQ